MGWPLATSTVADVVGIDADGTQLFSLFELLGGPGPYTAADVLAAFGLDQGVSGDGTLTLMGNTGDTDIDGLQDAWETTNFGNLDAGPGGDPDGDGLINLAEEAGATDPNESDAPGGGGGPPPVGGGDVDSDGDGTSDADEAIAGTNPNDASDYFRITELLNEEEGIELGWPAVADKEYEVQYSPDLVTWETIGTALMGIDGAAGFNDPDVERTSQAGGYYRAVVR